jgi:hypothetical protein
MKPVYLIVLILVFITGTVTSDAWADAQVYFTVSIGSGLIIGVVGVFIHVVFQQRIAQQRKEQKHLAVADLLLLSTQSEQSHAGTDGRAALLNQTDRAKLQIPDGSLYIERFDQINENRRAVHPALEANLFIFRW